MEALLIGLLWVVVWCAVIILVFEIVIWALGTMWPGSPAIVLQVLRVIEVILCVIVVLSWLLGTVPGGMKRPW